MATNTYISGGKKKKMLNNNNEQAIAYADHADEDDDISKDIETPDEFLSAVYYDPLNPGGYVGLEKLWKAVKGRLTH